MSPEDYEDWLIDQCDQHQAYRQQPWFTVEVPTHNQFMADLSADREIALYVMHRHVAELTESVTPAHLREMDVAARLEAALRYGR